MTTHDSPEDAKFKQFWAEIFGRSAATFDRVGPMFFSHFGGRLVELARVPKGARVLDIATGRGAILFPAAEAVGPKGCAIGIDLSAPMVHQTAMEIEQRGLTNAEVHCMDAEQLQFPEESFDYVLCGLSIFFFPQLERALAEMRRVLEPGGVIGATTFWHDDERWKWLGDLFKKYLPQPSEDETTAEDEEETPQPDFSSQAGMEAVMKSAGFADIRVVGEELGFIYQDEEAWWASLWSHGMRARLEKIERTAGREALQHFKAEAFRILQNQKQADGFQQMWSVLFTLATKPLD